MALQLITAARSLPFALCGQLFVYGGYWTIKALSTRCCVPCEIDQALPRAIHSHGRREIVCMTRLDVTPKTIEQASLLEVTVIVLVSASYTTPET